MQYLRTLLIGGLLAITTGCANGLNSVQKAELDAYESRGMAIRDKSPGAAAALGLLPGGGSFYGREYGYGVVNLLLWPLSILWDPVSGYDAARAINYNVTKAHVAKLHERELQELDDQLGNGQMDIARYTLEKRKVDSKYRAGF